MIPKIIHYCWFGKKEKPENLQKCIDTWKKLKGYEFIEWNEDNIQIENNMYAQKALENKKWAFLSDYIRLKALYEYGGIYLDTDVEIKKNFENKFLENDMFLSFMFNCNLSTAVIGAKPKNKIILNLLEEYENMKLEDVPNNDKFTRFFLDNFEEFKLNNKEQVLKENIKIYPKEYFECPSISKEKGYSVHHFAASWITKNKYKVQAKNMIKGIMGIYLYQNIMRYRCIAISPFKERYYKDKNK